MINGIKQCLLNDWPRKWEHSFDKLRKMSEIGTIL